MNEQSTDMDIPAQPKSRWKQLRTVVIYQAVILIDVIGILLSIGCLFWIMGDQSNFLSWHVTSLVPGIIALSPCVALIGLFRRRRWFAFHLLPAILFISLYGILYIPRSPDIPSATPQLRVMTFNTQFKHNPDIARIILEANADVVALQELVQPMADDLAEFLASEYPYQITHISPDAQTQGKGILSRYPMGNEQFDHLNNEVNYLRVQITFDDTPITIVNTHPSPPTWGIRFTDNRRSRHMDWIMDKLSEETGAIIVLGDFNTTDQSADYEQITSTYHDSVREVGLGLGQTFPDSTSWRHLQFIPPLIRIDYIFHSDDLQAVTAGAWHQSGGSDHRPVVANLIINTHQ